MFEYVDVGDVVVCCEVVCGCEIVFVVVDDDDVVVVFGFGLV